MKNTSIRILFLLILMTLSMTSCLNDLEDFMEEFSSSPAIAELSEASNPSTGTVEREIIDPTKTSSFSLRVNIASVYPLNIPTKVTLALDNALITEYNTTRELTGENAAVPVPLNAITIPSYNVTIPAGEREADWIFSVDAAKVPNPVTTLYIIPVRITNAENGVIPSGNFGTKLVRILAHN